MKFSGNKKLGILLILEAIVGIIFAVVFRNVGEGGFFKFIVLPVKQIGVNLRSLSLSGTAGNITAVILYIVISCLPLIFLAVLWKKKKTAPEDLLLVAISITAFIVIYWFINPGKMPEFSQVKNLLIIEAYPVLLLVSLVLAYVVIKIVKLLDGTNRKGMLKVLRGVSLFMMMVAVFAVFGSNLAELFSNLMEQKVSDLNPESNVRITQGIMILRYVVGQIPLIFMAILAKIVWDMVPEMKKTFVNNQVLESLSKLTKTCKASIVMIVLSQVVINLIQLLAGSYNNVSNINVYFPLMPIVLIAGLMIVSKLVEESAVIKKENEMFI